MKVKTTDPFDGMTNEESRMYQLEQWAKGVPLHNTVKDECCPDFGCCSPMGIVASADLRGRFFEAYKDGDVVMATSLLREILGTVEDRWKDRLEDHEVASPMTTN